MPKWNQKFAFKCNSTDKLYFIVYDEEKGDKNDLVCQGELEVSTRYEKETQI